MKKISCLPVLIFLIINGCAAHTNLVPLGKEKVEATAGLGGPFIPVTDPSIPAPYFTAGVNYGLNNKINIDGTLHLTSLFYKIAGLDFGFTYFPVFENEFIYALGIQPKLLIFSSLKGDVESSFRAYPVISVSGAWQLGSGLIYIGSDFTYPLSRPDYDNDAPRYILSPFMGYRWDLGKQYNLYTEVKVHGVNTRTDQSAVEYISINKYGAVSLLFSIGKEL